jgi:hypothetical protein
MWLQVLASPHSSSDRASTWSHGAATKSSSTSSTSGSDSLALYNREYEMECLAALCSGSPGGMSLILGPRNAGKTAVLQEYIRRRQLEGTICFINAREGAINTPSRLSEQLRRKSLSQLIKPLLSFDAPTKDFIDAVQNAAGALQEKVKIDGAEFNVGAAAFTAFLALFVKDTSKAAPLEVVIEAYKGLLSMWEQAKEQGRLQDDSPPLLVVDEANQLMAWGEEYKADRDALLAFLVDITKAQKRSHVLLATSEYAFQMWLNQGEAKPVLAVHQPPAGLHQGEARPSSTTCAFLLYQPSDGTP